MSIWCSVDGEDSLAVALDGHHDDANYRAEGDPELVVDVATTIAHDHIRVAIWDAKNSRHIGQGVDVCALLSPAAARELHRKLGEVLRRAPSPA